MDIHPRLLKDCIYLGRLSLSHVLLMNDSNYPWIILVPDSKDVTEIYQLDVDKQKQLIIESSKLSRYMANEFNADKMNVATIGNIVPQLHLHHVVRYEGDPAWPAPVWGKTPAVVYSEQSLNVLIKKLLKGLGSLDVGFIPGQR